MFFCTMFVTAVVMYLYYCADYAEKLIPPALAVGLINSLFI